MARRRKMPPMQTLRIDDPNFEHCAVTLLPFGIEFVRSLEVGQELDWNDINCLRIVAEVAQALAAEKYGKPRWRHTTAGWVPLFVPSSPSVPKVAPVEPTAAVEPCGPLFGSAP